MLPEFIIGNKSLSARLEEYTELLSNADAPCMDITETWATIFETYVVARVDWQALWVPSIKYCKKYDLLYPSTIIVRVDKCNWPYLTATVTVEAVDKDTGASLPDVLDVPIVELYPLKNQNYDEWGLKVMGDWLDKCRYFFKYLWYPWDEKNDVSLRDWCAAHLRNRLELQYDAKDGILGDFGKKYLKSLLNESQENNDNMENMRWDNIDEETCQFIHYHLRQKQIEEELKFLEDPDFRPKYIKIKLDEKNLENPPRKDGKGEVRLVWTGGAPKKFLHFSEDAEIYFPCGTTFKVSDTLQNSLDKSRKDDVIYLCDGEHLVESIGDIKYGGMIFGVGVDYVVIKPDSSKIKKAILFDSYGPLILTNLTIIREEGDCVQVCRESLEIKNCKIFGENSSTVKGIVVTSNCNLDLQDSELKGFSSGIIVQKGANVTIKNTRIHDCGIGIAVEDDAKLTLENVEISSCSNYGLKIKSSKVDSATPIVGNIDIVKDIEDFKFNSVVLNANRLGDVILKKSNSDDESFMESESEGAEFEDTIYLSDENDDSDCYVESADISENESKGSNNYDHDASK